MVNRRVSQLIFKPCVVLCALFTVTTHAEDGPAVTVTPAFLNEVTPSTSFNGRVEAVTTVDLRARVPGYLEDVAYTEGQFVEKGQKLFTIEKGQYQAQVDTVKGLIARLQGTMQLARIEQKRFGRLLERKVGSQDDYDRATAKVAETRGDILAQQAALERAELDLSYTDIMAPSAGRISRSAFDPGDFVGPLSGTLATIVSQDPIYVTFPVSQRELLDIRREAEESDLDASHAVVKVRLADGSVYQETGMVNFIDVASNPTTDTTLVRAEFPNPDGTLVHQQLVNVVVEEKATDVVLMVPQRSIQIDQAGSYVMKVDTDNTVQQQRIETGAIIGVNVIVTEGLEEGDQVIVSGIQKVRAGMKVQTTILPANGG